MKSLLMLGLLFVNSAFAFDCRGLSSIAQLDINPYHIKDNTYVGVSREMPKYSIIETAQNIERDLSPYLKVIDAGNMKNDIVVNESIRKNLLRTRIEIQKRITSEPSSAQIIYMIPNVSALASVMDKCIDLGFKKTACAYKKHENYQMSISGFLTREKSGLRSNASYELSKLGMLIQYRRALSKTLPRSVGAYEEVNRAYKPTETFGKLKKYGYSCEPSRSIAIDRTHRSVKQVRSNQTASTTRAKQVSRQ